MRALRSYLLVRIAFMLSAAAISTAAHGGENWQSLFNGKDLTGWTPKIRGYESGIDPARTFRVEDGLLSVNYDQYEAFDNQFGHLFYEAP